MKAEFSIEPSQKVKLVTQGNKIFVFITLNPIYVTRKDDEGNDTSYWEVDYNEFTVPLGTDVQDILEHPENYLEHTEYVIPTYEERIEALESAVFEIAESLFYEIAEDAANG